jgi:hypothetical protein
MTESSKSGSVLRDLVTGLLWPRVLVSGGSVSILFGGEVRGFAVYGGDSGSPTVIAVAVWLGEGRDALARRIPDARVLELRDQRRGDEDGCVGDRGANCDPPEAVIWASAFELSWWTKGRAPYCSLGRYHIALDQLEARSGFGFKRRPEATGGASASSAAPPQGAA